MASDCRVALITGAAGGIGSAAVEMFRQRGWDVIAIDQAEIKHPGSLAIRADLSQPDDFDRIVSRVRSMYSRLDAVVNNAAQQICKPLIETQPAEWDRVMSTNARAAYLLVVRLHSLLRSVRGCIVNVASIHALATSPGMAAYAASNGALISLTRSMAVELAADGIRANAVLPGAVDTPMLVAGLMRPGLPTANSPERSP